MERRGLGRTGLRVSALGLGGGAVGGLMVRGAPADQQRGVALALDAGITFIDTAPSYGDGASETNLGRVLAALRAGPDVVLATKFTIRPGEGRVADQIRESLDASLRRLRRDRVDLLQLHNAIGEDAATPGRSVPATLVLEEVAPALERLRDAGRIGAFGFTAVGDPDALAAVLDSGRFQTAQIPFNLLNARVDALVPRATAADVGTIGIRALAGGALSGSMWRHPIGATEVAPIATGETYADDVRASDRYRFLVEGGWASSLAAAAMRFAAHHGGLSTALIGVSTIDQLEAAIDAVERGPLPAEAIEGIEQAWRETAAPPH